MGMLSTKDETVLPMVYDNVFGLLLKDNKYHDNASSDHH